MDYGEVLSKAWKIVWKFKILWIFGILASCTGNAGSGVGSGGNNGVRYTVSSRDLPAIRNKLKLIMPSNIIE